MCMWHALHNRGLNPYLTTNGSSHHYQLDESTFIFRDFTCKSDFTCLSQFLMKFLLANRIAPDGTPISAASNLGLFGLPMSLKRDARLKCVKQIKIARLK